MKTKSVFLRINTVFGKLGLEWLRVGYGPRPTHDSVAAAVEIDQSVKRKESTKALRRSGANLTAKELVTSALLIPLLLEFPQALAQSATTSGTTGAATTTSSAPGTAGQSGTSSTPHAVIPAGTVLDLGSSAASIQAPNSAPVSINQNGSVVSILPGQLLTAGQFLAVRQVINGYGQHIVLDGQGIATGGFAGIGSHSTSSLAALTIPSNVSLAAFGFNASNPLNITGAAIVGGALNLVQNQAGIASVLNAGSLTVLPGGMISGNLPTAFASSAMASAGMTLNVAGNLINQGIITAPGALNISALGSILNQSSIASTAVMNAQNLNLFTGAGSIVNSGIIQATTALNIATSAEHALQINNSGGTIRSVLDAINIRDSAFSGIAATSLVGGDWFSKELNIHGGCGAVSASVNEVGGLLNLSGATAEFGVNQGTLNIASMNLSGDPIYYNSGGNVDISGLFSSGSTFATNGGDLIVLAKGDVTAAGAPASALLDASSSGAAGGSIVIAAGVNFTTSNAACVTCVNGVDYSILGASGTGGSISLSNVSLKTNTKSVSLQANAGTLSTGSISIGNVSSSGNGGTTGAGGSGGTLSVQASGSILTGTLRSAGGGGLGGIGAGFVGGSGGAINVLSTGGGSITVLGDINSSGGGGGGSHAGNGGAGGAAGAVTVSSSSSVLVTGPVLAVGGGGGSAGILGCCTIGGGGSFGGGGGATTYNGPVGPAGTLGSGGTAVFGIGDPDAGNVAGAGASYVGAGGAAGASANVAISGSTVSVTGTIGGSYSSLYSGAGNNPFSTSPFAGVSVAGKSVALTSSSIFAPTVTGTVVISDGGTLTMNANGSFVSNLNNVAVGYVGNLGGTATISNSSGLSISTVYLYQNLTGGTLNISSSGSLTVGQIVGVSLNNKAANDTLKLSGADITINGPISTVGSTINIFTTSGSSGNITLNGPVVSHNSSISLNATAGATNNIAIGNIDVSGLAATSSYGAGKGGSIDIQATGTINTGYLRSYGGGGLGAGGTGSPGGGGGAISVTSSGGGIVTVTGDVNSSGGGGGGSNNGPGGAGGAAGNVSINTSNSISVAGPILALGGGGGGSGALSCCTIGGGGSFGGGGGPTDYNGPQGPAGTLGSGGTAIFGIGDTSGGTVASAGASITGTGGAAGSSGDVNITGNTITIAGSIGGNYSGLYTGGGANPFTNSPFAGVTVAGKSVNLSAISNTAPSVTGTLVVSDGGSLSMTAGGSFVNNLNNSAVGYVGTTGGVANITNGNSLTISTIYLFQNTQGGSLNVTSGGDLTIGQILGLSLNSNPAAETLNLKGQNITVNGSVATLGSTINATTSAGSSGNIVINSSVQAPGTNITLLASAGSVNNISTLDVDVSGFGGTASRAAGNGGKISIQAAGAINTGYLRSYGGGGSGGSGSGAPGGKGGAISVDSTGGMSVTINGDINSSGGGGGAANNGTGGAGGAAGNIAINASSSVSVSGPILAVGGGGGGAGAVIGCCVSAGGASFGGEGSSAYYNGATGPGGVLGTANSALFGVGDSGTKSSGGYVGAPGFGNGGGVGGAAGSSASININVGTLSVSGTIASKYAGLYTGGGANPFTSSPFANVSIAGGTVSLTSNSVAAPVPFSFAGQLGLFTSGGNSSITAASPTSAFSIPQVTFYSKAQLVISTPGSVSVGSGGLAVNSAASVASLSSGYALTTLLGSSLTITASSGIGINGDIVLPSGATGATAAQSPASVTLNSMAAAMITGGIDVSGIGATTALPAGAGGKISLNGGDIKTKFLRSFGGGGVGASTGNSTLVNGGNGGTISLTSSFTVSVSGDINTSGGGGGAAATGATPGYGGTAGTIAVNSTGSVVISGPVLAAGGGGGAAAGSNGGKGDAGASFGGGGGAPGGAAGGGLYGGGSVANANTGGGIFGGGLAPSGSAGAVGKGGAQVGIGGVFGAGGDNQNLVGQEGAGSGGSAGANGAVTITGTSVSVTGKVSSLSGLSSGVPNPFSTSPFANVSIYSGNLNISATNGNASVSGDIQTSNSAVSGSVKIDAQNGGVLLNGFINTSSDIGDGGNVTLSSDVQRISVAGYINTSSGGVSVFTKNGFLNAYAGSILISGPSSTKAVAAGNAIVLNSIIATGTNGAFGGDVLIDLKGTGCTTCLNVQHGIDTSANANTAGSVTVSGNADGNVLFNSLGTSADTAINTSAKGPVHSGGVFKVLLLNGGAASGNVQITGGITTSGMAQAQSGEVVTSSKFLTVTGTIDTSNPLTAGAAVDLATGADLNVFNIITSGGTASNPTSSVAGAGGLVMIASGTSGAGNFSAKNITTSGAGKGFAAGSIVVTSTGTISASNLTLSGKTNLDGTASGGTVSLLAGTPATDGSISTGSIDTTGAAGGNVALVSLGKNTSSINSANITTDATISDSIAGSVSISAPGLITLGNVSAKALVGGAQNSSYGGDIVITTAATGAAVITTGTIDTSAFNFAGNVFLIVQDPVAGSTTMNIGGVTLPDGTVPASILMNHTGGAQPGTTGFLYDTPLAFSAPLSISGNTTVQLSTAGTSGNAPTSNIVNFSPGGYANVAAGANLTIDTLGDSRLFIPIAVLSNDVPLNNVVSQVTAGAASPVSIYGNGNISVASNITLSSTTAPAPSVTFQTNNGTVALNSVNLSGTIGGSLVINSPTNFTLANGQSLSAQSIGNVGPGGQIIIAVPFGSIDLGTSGNTTGNTINASGSSGGLIQVEAQQNINNYGVSLISTGTTGSGGTVQIASFEGSVNIYNNHTGGGVNNANIDVSSSAGIGGNVIIFGRTGVQISPDAASTIPISPSSYINANGAAGGGSISISTGVVVSGALPVPSSIYLGDAAQLSASGIDPAGNVTGKGGTINLFTPTGTTFATNLYVIGSTSGGAVVSNSSNFYLPIGDYVLATGTTGSGGTIDIYTGGIKVYTPGSIILGYNQSDPKGDNLAALLSGSYPVSVNGNNSMGNYMSTSGATDGGSITILSGGSFTSYETSLYSSGGINNALAFNANGALPNGFVNVSPSASNPQGGQQSGAIASGFAGKGGTISVSSAAHIIIYNDSTANVSGQHFSADIDASSLNGSGGRVVLYANGNISSFVDSALPNDSYISSSGTMPNANGSQNYVLGSGQTVSVPTSNSVTVATIGGNIDLSNVSKLTARNTSTTAGATGGTITVIAPLSAAYSVLGGNITGTTMDASETGNATGTIGGSVLVSGTSFLMPNATNILANATGGKGGTVTLAPGAYAQLGGTTQVVGNALAVLSADNFSNNSISASGAEAGGLVTITSGITGSAIVINDCQVSLLATSDAGKGGTILINNNSALTLYNAKGLVAGVNVNSNSNFDVSSNNGDGGSISISSSGAILSLQDPSVASASLAATMLAKSGSANGGAISISTTGNTIDLSQYLALDASATGTGKGGSISVTGPNSPQFTGTSLLASGGDGGSVTVNVVHLGCGLCGGTFTQPNGFNIDASGTIGSGGKVNITAAHWNLGSADNRTNNYVSASGATTGGSIMMDTGTFDDYETSLYATGGSGDGGLINLQSTYGIAMYNANGKVGAVNVNFNANIDASSTGAAGGTINIYPGINGNFITLPDSKVTTSAAPTQTIRAVGGGGKGGTIVMDAIQGAVGYYQHPAVNLRQTALVDVSSTAGASGGSVTLNAYDVVSLSKIDLSGSSGGSLTITAANTVGVGQCCGNYASGAAVVVATGSAGAGGTVGITAGADATMGASGIFANFIDTSGTTSGGNVTISAVGNVTLYDFPIKTSGGSGTGGTIQLSSSTGNVTLYNANGKIGALAVSAGSDLLSTSTTGNGGAITISAVNGGITSLMDPALTSVAASTQVIDASAGGTGGTITLSAKGAIGLAMTKSITANGSQGGQVSITSTTSSVALPAVSANPSGANQIGSISVTANATITDTIGLSTSAPNITLTSTGGDVALTHAYTASGSMTLQATAGKVTSTDKAVGLDTAKLTVVSGAGGINIALTNAVMLQANSSGAVSITDSATSTISLAASSGTSFILNASDSNSGISGTGALSAASVNLTAGKGGISFTGSNSLNATDVTVASQGAVSLVDTANSVIQINPSSATAFKLVANQTNSGILGIGLLQAATVNLTAGTAGIDFSTKGSLNATTLSVNSTGQVNLIDSNGLNLDASNVGDLTLSAGANGTVAITGDVKASGTINVVANGKGAITNAGGFTLDSKILNLTSGSGDMGTGKAPIIVSAGTLTVNTSGSVFVNDTGAVTLNGSNVGSLTLNSANSGDIAIAGNTKASGTLALNAAGNITNALGFTLTAGDVQLTAAGNVGLSGNPILVSSGFVSAKASGASGAFLSSNGAVSLNASQASGSTFSLLSTGAVTTVGDVTAKDVVIHTSTGAGISFGSIVTGTASADIRAAGAGTITGTGGKLVSPSTVLRSGSGDITTLDTATASLDLATTGNVQLNNTGVLSVTADVGSLTLTNSADLAVGKVTAGTVIDLSAAGDITTSGVVQGTNVTLQSTAAKGSIALGASLTGSAAVTLNAAGAGTVTSNSSIGSGVVTISSGSGDLGTSFLPLLTTGTGLKLSTSGNAYLSQSGNAVAVQASTIGGALELGSSTTVTVGGVLSTGSTKISATGSAGIIINANSQSTNAATLSTSGTGSITIGAAVSSSKADVQILSSQITNNGSISSAAAAGQVLLSNVIPTGSVSLGGTGTISTTGGGASKISVTGGDVTISGSQTYDAGATGVVDLKGTATFTLSGSQSISSGAKTVITTPHLFMGLGSNLSATGASVLSIDSPFTNLQVTTPDGGTGAISTAGGTITFTAAGSIDVNKSAGASTGALSLSASTVAYNPLTKVLNVAANSTLSSSSDQSFDVSNVTNDGIIDSAGSTKFQVTNSLTIAGAGKITGGALLAGSTNGAVSIVQSDISAPISGAAQGDYSVTTNGAMLTSGSITSSAGSIGLSNSTGGVAVADGSSIMAASNVTLSGASSVAVGTGVGGVTISAGKIDPMVVSSSTNMSDFDISAITSPGRILLSSLSGTVNVAPNAGLNSFGGSIGISAGGNISVGAGASVFAQGGNIWLNGLGNINVGAGANFTAVARDVPAGAPVYMVNEGISIGAYQGGSIAFDVNALQPNYDSYLRSAFEQQRIAAGVNSVTGPGIDTTGTTLSTINGGTVTLLTTNPNKVSGTFLNVLGATLNTDGGVIYIDPPGSQVNINGGMFQAFGPQLVAVPPAPIVPVAGGGGGGLPVVGGAPGLAAIPIIQVDSVSSEIKQTQAARIVPLDTIDLNVPLSTPTSKEQQCVPVPLAHFAEVSDGEGGWLVSSGYCETFSVEGSNGSAVISAGGTQLAPSRDGTVVMNQGKIVAMSGKQGMTVDTSEGRVHLAADSAVMIQDGGRGVIRITQLAGAQGSVEVGSRSGQKKSVPTHTGHEIMIAVGGADQEELIAADGIDRVPVGATMTMADLVVKRSEIDPKQLLDRDKLLNCSTTGCFPVRLRTRLGKMRAEAAGSKKSSPLTSGIEAPYKKVGFVQPAAAAAASSAVTTVSSPSGTIRYAGDARFNLIASGAVALRDGEILVAPQKTTIVTFGNFRVKVAAGAIAAIKREDHGCVRVRALCDSATGSITAFAGAAPMPVPAGHELVVAPSDADLTEFLRGDGVAKRRVLRLQTSTGERVLISEASFVSTVNDCDILSALFKSQNAEDRAISKRILKMAVALSVVTSVHGNYNPISPRD